MTNNPTNNPVPRAGRRIWLLIGGVAVVAVLALAAAGLKMSFEANRPVTIRPLSAIPAEWKLPPGTKFEDLTEYFVEYKLTGELPGKPNDQYYLVVESGPDSTPYMRTLNGDDLKKGGSIGLAVAKRGVKYTVSLRGFGPQGNGPRYSNVLTFTF